MIFFAVDSLWTVRPAAARSTRNNVIARSSDKYWIFLPLRTP